MMRGYEKECEEESEGRGKEKRKELKKKRLKEEDGGERRELGGYIRMRGRE